MGKMNQGDLVLELAKLNYERGDFSSAVNLFIQSSEVFLADKSFAKYLKAQNYLLRAYSELENTEMVNQTKDRLQDLVLKEGFDLTSKSYYTLGVCAFYKRQVETALEYGRKGLALALQKDEKEDMCYSIYLIAAALSDPSIGKYVDALKEIYNLEVFFQVYDFPEIKMSASLLNADILRTLKRYDEAIEVLWKAYDHIRSSKNMMMSSYLLWALGRTYSESGDKDMARTYLTLANRSIDPKNQVRLSRLVKLELEHLGGDIETSFDLVFDELNHAVTEKKMGKIDFKNQFILLDLLKLFVQNPGAVFSKEYLVENVWKQPYDPAVHDNKIYVTIKRLRKLIEPDYDKPKYIFRAKNGYYMNKTARVQIGV